MKKLKEKAVDELLEDRYQKFRKMGIYHRKVSAETPVPKDLAAIKGTHDILPGEVELWQKVEADGPAACSSSTATASCARPIIEPTELFEKGTGETTDIVTKEMYTFTDKGGRSITLRPEYTPSVARAIIEHRLDLLSPTRSGSITSGPMFRYDKPQKGRYRQFHQIDIEVFNEKDPAIDAEIIEMADALLKPLGVDGSRDARQFRRLPGLPAGAIRGTCGRTRRRSATGSARTASARSRPTLSASSTARSKAAGSRPRTFPRSRTILCRGCRDAFRQGPRRISTFTAWPTGSSRTSSAAWTITRRRRSRSSAAGSAPQNAAPRRRPLRRHDEGFRRAGHLRHRLRHGHGAADLRPDRSSPSSGSSSISPIWARTAKRKALELARLFRRGGVESLVEFGRPELQEPVRPGQQARGGLGLRRRRGRDRERPVPAQGHGRRERRPKGRPATARTDPSGIPGDAGS